MPIKDKDYATEYQAAYRLAQRNRTNKEARRIARIQRKEELREFVKSLGLGCAKPMAAKRIKDATFKGICTIASGPNPVDVLKAMKVRDSWKHEKNSVNSETVKCLICKKPLYDWDVRSKDDPVCPTCDAAEIRIPDGWAGYGGGHHADDFNGTWDNIVSCYEEAE